MISKELIRIYIDRFVNRTDIWSRQWIRKDGTDCGYAYQKPDMVSESWRYEPVTLDLVQRHFEGLVTCAWPAVDERFCSKWLCFDSDTANGALGKLDSALRSWNVHVISEGKRIGRDGHLWILFDEPVPAESLITLGDAVMRLAEVSGIERFPKSSTGLSAMHAPLGINLKPEANRARGWFEGAQPDIRAQLEWLAEQRLNRATDALREAELHRIRLAEAHSDPSNKTWSGKSFTRFPILRFVNARRSGNELIAQCPVCAIQGHDRHRDNLRITMDGLMFTCVFQGPGREHKRRDIISALLSGRR